MMPFAMPPPPFMVSEKVGAQASPPLWTPMVGAAAEVAQFQCLDTGGAIPAGPREPPARTPKLTTAGEVLPPTTAPATETGASALFSAPPSWAPTTWLSGGAASEPPTQPPSWTPTIAVPPASAGAHSTMPTANQVVGSSAPPMEQQGGDVGPLPSAGSTLHVEGKCSPCAWFWKPRGCSSGAACDYCHLCPADELNKRKKEKVKLIRKGLVEPKARRGGC
jgi:hypothetical protein